MFPSIPRRVAQATGVSQRRQDPPPKSTLPFAAGPGARPGGSCNPLPRFLQMAPVLRVTRPVPPISRRTQRPRFLQRPQPRGAAPPRHPGDRPAATPPATRCATTWSDLPVTTRVRASTCGATSPAPAAGPAPPGCPCRRRSPGRRRARPPKPPTAGPRKGRGLDAAARRPRPQRRRPHPQSARDRLLDQ